MASGHRVSRLGGEHGLELGRGDGYSRDHRVTSLAAYVPQQGLKVSVLSYSKTSELMGCGNLAPKSLSLVKQRPQVHQLNGPVRRSHHKSIN